MLLHRQRVHQCSRDTEMNEFLSNSVKISTHFRCMFQQNLLGLLNTMIQMMFEVQNFRDRSYYTLIVHKKDIAILLVCVCVCVCVCVWLVGVKLYLLYHCNCKQNECAKPVSYQRGVNKTQNELLICWTVYLYSRICNVSSLKHTHTHTHTHTHAEKERVSSLSNTLSLSGIPRPKERFRPG